MTRRGRAGRKFQLRRLVKALRDHPVPRDHLLGTEYFPDPEYEAYFQSPTSLSDRREHSECRDTHPYRVPRIEFVYPPALPPVLEASRRDPRIRFYTALRAEYLHFYYGASTPPGSPVRITTADPDEEIRILKERARKAALHTVHLERGILIETVTLD